MTVSPILIGFVEVWFEVGGVHEVSFDGDEEDEERNKGEVR